MSKNLNENLGSRESTAQKADRPSLANMVPAAMRSKFLRLSMLALGAIACDDDKPVAADATTLDGATGADSAGQDAYVDAATDVTTTVKNTICPPDQQPALYQQFTELGTTLDQCKACHKPGGIGWKPAKGIGWGWDASPVAAAQQASFESFYKVAGTKISNGDTWIVKYPKGQIARPDGTTHGGGEQAFDLAQEAQLQQFAEQLQEYVKSMGGEKDGKLPPAPTIKDDCDSSKFTEADLFKNVELRSRPEVYIKFLMMIGASIPDQLPDIKNDDQLMQMILQATEHPGFYDWLKTEFNNRTLTRGLAKDGKIAETMGNTYGIDWTKFDPFEVADSPNLAFAWAVKNNRDIREIFKGPYVVTPGQKPAPGKPDDWLARATPKPTGTVPFAGLYSHRVWLMRHPSSATNVNRNRSRISALEAYDLDILSLGSRKVPPPDPTIKYPTLGAKQCLPCHANSPLDLGARAFTKFDVKTGLFIPGALEPVPISLINIGLYGHTIPHNPPNALQQYMHLVTLDPDLSPSDPGYDSNRKYPFAKARAKEAFEFLMQREPSLAPKEGEANYEAKMRRYAVENEFLNQLADFLHKNNYNFRKLIAKMATSKWYAVTGNMTNGDELSTDRGIELANMGPVPNTPEIIAKRLRQLLGPNADKMGLTQQVTGQFNLDLGGIDSQAITVRKRLPTSSYELRLDAIALDQVGKIVIADLAKKPNERHMFPYLADWNNVKLESPVSLGTKEVNDKIQLKFKQTMTLMLRRAYGKYHAVDSKEVQALYGRWLEIWDKFSADVGNGKIASKHQVPGLDAGDPYGLIRAWVQLIAEIVQGTEFNISKAEPGEKDHVVGNIGVANQEFELDQLEFDRDPDEYFEGVGENGKYEKLFAVVDPRTNRLKIAAGVRKVMEPELKKAA